MRKLTDRQQEVLNFIEDYKANSEEYPSVRTIAKAFNVTVRAAQQHIEILKKKEYLVYRKPVTVAYEINRRS